MSESVQPSSFSANYYIENAGDIRIANQINGQQMEQLFAELVVKAQEYRNRWQSAEVKNDALKNVIVKQWQQINQLHDKLDDITKKLHLAELASQGNEKKYNRIYGKLKEIILDSAADSGNSQEAAL